MIQGMSLIHFYDSIKQMIVGGKHVRRLNEKKKRNSRNVFQVGC